MSRDASVKFEWADGEYMFRLRLGEIRELQEKCNAGPLVLLRRCIDGSWMIDDLRETIRLGLIGGGCDPIKALNLIKRYFDERALMENMLPAHKILQAAVLGVPDEQPGKSEAEGASASDDDRASYQMANSLSPHSTEAVQ